MLKGDPFENYMIINLGHYMLTNNIKDDELQ